MISVPTSTGSVPTPTPAQQGPDEVYLMMAAAQMHKEGRLIQSGIPDTVQGGQPLQPYKPGYGEGEAQGHLDLGGEVGEKQTPQIGDIQNLFRNRIRTQVGDKPLGQKI